MMPRAKNGRSTQMPMMVHNSRDASYNSSWSQSSDSAETLWTITEMPSGKCATPLRSHSSQKIRRRKVKISSRPSSKSGSTLLMLYLR